MQLARLLWCISAAVLAWGQTDPDPAYRRMLESKRAVTEYLNRSARAITDRAAAEVARAETWEKVREQRREELRDMLGLLPWPERTPLNVTITGKLEREEYIIEKIAFESVPNFYVTGNLYIPKQRKGRAPAVIYVCGHAPSEYGAKTEYQRHGISLAKNGYVAFILDPIQIAEMFRRTTACTRRRCTTGTRADTRPPGWKHGTPCVPSITWNPVRRWTATASVSPAARAERQ